MNKEQHQIIDEVYDNYLKNWKPQPVVENEYYWIESEFVSDRPLPTGMFIHRIKKDSEFSEKWGLQIEERELSLEERIKIWQNQQDGRGHFIMELLDNIPTKLITLTYNNETVESYE